MTKNADNKHNHNNQPQQEQDPKLKTRMARLLTDPANQVCADCPAKRPIWCSFLSPPRDVLEELTEGRRLGVFCCSKCIQQHYFELKCDRTLIKSLQVTHEWSLADVAVLETSGNAMMNAIYEAKLTPQSFDKALVLDEEEEEEARRARFIKHKYKKLKYFDELVYYQKIRSSEIAAAKLQLQQEPTRGANERESQPARRSHNGEKDDEMVITYQRSPQNEKTTRHHRHHHHHSSHSSHHKHQDIQAKDIRAKDIGKNTQTQQSKSLPEEPHDKDPTNQQNTLKEDDSFGGAIFAALQRFSFTLPRQDLTHLAQQALQEAQQAPVTRDDLETCRRMEHAKHVMQDQTPLDTVQGIANLSADKVVHDALLAVETHHHKHHNGNTAVTTQKDNQKDEKTQTSDTLQEDE